MSKHIIAISSAIIAVVFAIFFEGENGSKIFYSFFVRISLLLFTLSISSLICEIYIVANTFEIIIEEIDKSIRDKIKYDGSRADNNIFKQKILINIGVFSFLSGILISALGVILF